MRQGFSSRARGWIVAASAMAIPWGVGSAEEPAPSAELTTTEVTQAPVLETSFIGGGAGTSSSNSYWLAGSLGAPDAAGISSPSFVLLGGFMGSGPVGDPGYLFNDNFETGDVGTWSTAIP